MDTFFWIIAIAFVLIVIGAFVSARWVLKKGHQGYMKSKEAIKKRRK